VSVPVTADIEAGYRLSPGDLVERLLDAGAVGCNLEDTDHHGGTTYPEGGGAYPQRGCPAPTMSN
jgi:2-methylisocitrate lyase-like PEP mutase family enzyme